MQMLHQLAGLAAFWSLSILGTSISHVERFLAAIVACQGNL
jgi:hypothetical protein